jgi:N6-L-threonylcarbamoyladenine synthase
MKDIYIMAIETSCDETSIAIIKNGHEILSHVINSQAEEFSSLGGVVPEMASRMHVDNICIVYKEALTKANLKITDIDAIATTF